MPIMQNLWYYPEQGKVFDLLVYFINIITNIFYCESAYSFSYLFAIQHIIAIFDEYLCYDNYHISC